LLNVWPALPIVIDASITDSRRSGVTNIIAALKQHDLVCRIRIWGIPNSLFKSATMKKQFPMLTSLALFSNEDKAPVIPNSFLGGSAPRLQSLELRDIPFPFPALGKLLLSATDLVILRLHNIPNSGIISPDLIVTTLSRLTRLQDLFIGFRSPRSHADRERRHLSFSKRLVFPSLTKFHFKGDAEYLEEFVGKIDTPALDSVAITFFNQLTFDTPQLRDFFSRTEVFREPYRADVLVAKIVRLTLSRLEGSVEHRMLDVTILSSVTEWQVSSLARFCSSSFPPLHTLERLSISGFIIHDINPESTDEMESSQWLELLQPFVAMRDLVLRRDLELAGQAATALQELTGNTAIEVLPALRRIFVHPVDTDRIQRILAPFITARQLSGYTVSVHPLPRE
jgi:hypothetical protein